MKIFQPPLFLSVSTYARSHLSASHRQASHLSASHREASHLATAAFLFPRNRIAKDEIQFLLVPVNVYYCRSAMHNNFYLFSLIFFYSPRIIGHEETAGACTPQWHRDGLEAPGD